MDPRDRVGRFVRQARRVLAHSLAREHRGLLKDAAYGAFTLKIQVDMQTGESTHRIKKKLPPEEDFESFAARLRPFTGGKEPIYWAAVLDAAEKLLSKETLTEIVDMESLRKYWQWVVEGSDVAGYYVMTENGSMSDVRLADLWLNSDSLHTQVIQSAVGRDLSINERYQAAVGVYSRIGACAVETYIWIRHLVQVGLLDLDRSDFTQQVVADHDIDMPARMFCAPVGAAPMPTDMSELDLNLWPLVHEDPAVLSRLGERLNPGAAQPNTPGATRELLDQLREELARRTAAG